MAPLPCYGYYCTLRPVKLTRPDSLIADETGVIGASFIDDRPVPVTTVPGGFGR